MFHTNVVEQIKTHILCSVIPPPKTLQLWGNVEKYGGAGQATDNMARALRMLDN
jgi:hypothetical protein